MRDDSTRDLFAPSTAPEPRPHPAPWSPPLIDALRAILPPPVALWLPHLLLMGVGAYLIVATLERTA